LKEVKRFSPAQRAAHFLVSLTGMLLIITGLPITFSTQLRWVIDLMGGSEITMFIHRICGLILVFSLAYFGTYFIIKRITKGRGDSNISFHPKFFLQLAKDMVQDMLWTFGLTKERPKSGKYDWVMVADIFAVPIFCLIEIITGAVMWFPYPALEGNPALFFVFRTIHTGVAILAVFFVLAHATILHFTPGNFPINMGIFSGLIPKHKAEEEFPLWNPEEEIETKSKPYQFHPIGYVAGIASCLIMLLMVYVTFLLTEEGLAGLRLLDDNPVAFLALNGTIVLMIVYVLMTFYGTVKALAK
jgi:cytochrome b subunit of formate dehydrogenase